MLSKEKEAFVIEAENDGTYLVRRSDAPKKVMSLDRSFDALYSGYGVFPENGPIEKMQKRGHWLWRAFRQSRFTYFQVIVASILINFLALTTSIFTMTVYDRVIPNAAVESLIALSIGAVLALGFDFIIKTCAGFIDRASKSTDLKVSNTLFSVCWIEISTFKCI